jgi:hypothetical protein
MALGLTTAGVTYSAKARVSQKYFIILFSRRAAEAQRFYFFSPRLRVSTCEFGLKIANTG